MADGMTSAPGMVERWARYLDFARARSGDDWVIWSELIQEFPSGPDTLDRMPETVEKGARGYSYVARKGVRSDVLYVVNHWLGFSEYWVRRAAPVLFAVYRRLLKAGAAAGAAAMSVHPSNVYDNRIYMVRRAARKDGVNLKAPASKFTSPRLRPNYSTLKIFYYFERYRRFFPAPGGRPQVLEVGAGAANFPILFAKHYEEVAYFIVDLPGMILTSSSQIERFLPGARQILPHEATAESVQRALAQRGHLFVLLTPDQVDLVPGGAFDLAVNMESFAEMEPETASGYLEDFYAKLRPGGTLFLVNRESRVASTTGDVEDVTSFWKYPLRDDDEVLVRKHCPMRDLISFGKAPNIVYVGRTRIAREAAA
jgi:putative sugar O-methyltransferase